MSKYSYENLNMCVAGEQEKNSVTIPVDEFNLSDDKELTEKYSSDERTDKFIYAYTDSGLSTNNRNWKPEIMKSIAGQVIEKLPVGYLGHIKPKDYGYEFPEPQIVWFGSCIQTLESGTSRLWLKGYILETSTKLINWIKAKAVDSISVYGKIEYIEDENKVLQIQSVDLKSIDISRKLGEGLNSAIIGLSGEMADNYDELRNDLSSVCESYFKEIFDGDSDYSKIVNGVPVNNLYCWVQTMSIDNKTAYVEVEGNCREARKIFKVFYKNGDSIEITGHEEVVRKTIYEPVKKNKEEVGEMEKNSKEDIIKGLTISDIEKNNPSLIEAIAKKISEKDKDSKKKKSEEKKAGEMDRIIGVVGGECDTVFDTVKNLFETSKSFAGEMASLFCGEQDGAEVTPEKIVEKAKEVVADNKTKSESLDAISKAVGAGEDKPVEEAVKEVVNANKVNINKEAIEEVNNVFEELAKEVKDESILEFIKDDMDDVLSVKPEDIKEEDWKENSINYIKNKFPVLVKKYEERLKKIYEKGKAVGEMNDFMNLTLAGEQSEESSSLDEDIEAAKKLGYGR